MCVCVRLVPPLTESKVCLQKRPKMSSYGLKTCLQIPKVLSAEKRKPSEKSWESSMGDLSLNQKRGQCYPWCQGRHSRARDHIRWIRDRRDALILGNLNLYWFGPPIVKFRLLVLLVLACSGYMTCQFRSWCQQAMWCHLRGFNFSIPCMGNKNTVSNVPAFEISIYI